MLNAHEFGQTTSSHARAVNTARALLRSFLLSDREANSARDFTHEGPESDCIATARVTRSNIGRWAYVGSCFKQQSAGVGSSSFHQYVR